ncbi:SNF2-related protein [Thioalkalivibrio nitratireducens DSM 14787]|uniref:SNF2-related protein n=1 Tax=Thioalkalivibrio nitratireducens (strain DSM 14787 / UNIQEM 213 / ALEN2) TaxID=1255043 RepID=L0DWI8_THIND|nr:DEAD/DEAH box helicase [Thioalkalivibrio nitratireducens]AGA33388.1 SNF2-related protein [Thioalkalivibrio nitratireducens DSM 14787]
MSSPMPPSTAVPHPEPVSAVDPLRLDTEQIEVLALPEVIRAALRHSSERRVTALDRTDESLWAQVEDEQTGEKLELEIVVRDDGSLGSLCGCQGAGPDDTGFGAPCVHAIAALFAYTQGQGEAGKLADAAQEARAERIAKARSEVRVQPLTESAGETGKGLWSARSIQSSTHFPTRYRVHIRSLERRANHCTCPDFATNQLGTCKHIEAVLHRIRKRPDYDTLKALPLARPYVHLDWECDDPPVLRLHRAAGMAADLEALLDEHFDAGGAFSRRVPDDFLRFAERVRDRDDIDLGDDALTHARRLAEDAARAVRAAEIRERIDSGGGHLPGIRARLHPYQAEGVAFLAGRGRALLADDMGLGKTLQAIASAYWMRQHDGVERVLVVCPASLKLQWAREIEKFTGLEAQVVQGPVDTRGAQYRNPSPFHVVNYELVMRDLPVINDTLRPDLLILDEAQRIKNWRTKIASAVKRVQSRYAFVLTGTPLENRLEDLYSLMQVIDSRVLGPLWRYLVDFHVTDDRGKVLGYRNLSELRRRLRPVMLRRDRSLVRDQLPERIVQRIDVPMSGEQEGIHEAALKAAGQLAQIMRRRPLTPSEQNRMLAALQQARMACDAAGLVDKETDGSPKLDELETLLDELCRSAGLKAVVFSQWERMTEMAEQRVRRLGLGSVRLHGGVPTQKRGALMDRFREDDAVQVFLSTDAGGVGLNLQNAAVLINLDIPWNPAVLDQRIARVHRLGQKQKVQAILLVAPGSYEERVLGLVEGKRQLFDNVVDPEATEEVVSVSRRLAEILASDLVAMDTQRDDAPASGSDSGAGAETPEVISPELEPGAEVAAETAADASQPATAAEREIAATGQPDRDAAVRDCIVAMQREFGARIERILGQRGQADGGIQAGLVLVLDHVDEQDDRAIAGLSGDIPVALIDRRTLSSLHRLGAASPLAGAEPVYAPEEAKPARPAVHPLARKATENLAAARLLLQQGSAGPALDLLLGALLAAAALRTGRNDAPTPQQAGVWLYGEALPSGQIDPTDAAVLMQALALAQAGDSVPEALLGGMLIAAETFIQSSLSGSGTKAVAGS